MQTFAIPTINNVLTTHFGHCEKFAIVSVDQEQIKQVDYISPPQHQPGSYPAFLANKGVQVIIAGGMGQKALDLFAQYHIEVCIGAENLAPEILVEQYLHDQLVNGQNLCDH